MRARDAGARLLVIGALGLVGTACPPPSSVDGGIPSSPHVTISVDEANVIGKSVSARIRVSSCRNVNQVQLLQEDQFLADVPFSTNPATIEILPEHLRTWWPKGIAASLTLKAKVICDDVRTAESSAVSATFFPIDRRIASPTGGAAAPDLFTTQGGLGGTPVTFIGCIKRGETGTTPALAISNTDGQHVMSNESVPPCDGTTQVSERSAATGTRWVLQPGVAAYSIDQNLNILKIAYGDLRRMGVASNGIGIFWAHSPTEERVVKLSPEPDTSSDWVTSFVTTKMNGDPVVDLGNQAVWVPSWQDTSSGSTRVGQVVVYKFDLLTGALLNPEIAGGGPPVVLQQTFDAINTPIVPEVTFSPDATILYAPILSVSAQNTVQTIIVACSTLTSGCQGAARKWATPSPFDRQLTNVFPFSHGNLLAAVGPKGAWFLKAQDGSVVSAGNNPVTPSLGLQVLGVQAGLGSDVYLLSGPVLGENVPVYPNELVAIDTPENGELYRFGFGDGTAAETGITMGIDEGGQAWYRVGADLVKPYALSWYRQIKNR